MVSHERFIGDPMLAAKIKPTTFRIEPTVKAGLERLGKLLHMPQNDLVNDALKEYVDRRSGQLADELENTAKNLRAFQLADPDFEKSITAFAEDESRNAAHDPAEGHIVRQETQSLSRAYSSE